MECETFPLEHLLQLLCCSNTMKRAAHVRICCHENYLQCLFQLHNMSCIFHSPALPQKTGGGGASFSGVCSAETLLLMVGYEIRIVGAFSVLVNQVLSSLITVCGDASLLRSALSIFFVTSDG